MTKKGIIMSDAKNVKKIDKKKAIAELKEEIIKECKLLATFKVSSAVNINEKTKQLLKLEKSAD